MKRPHLRARFRRRRPEPNGVLIPYFLLSAAISVALCVVFPRSGAAVTKVATGIAAIFLLWLAAFVALALLLGLFLTAASLFVDPTKPQRTYEPFYHGVINYCMGIIWAISRVRIRMIGMERLPEEPFLLVCNHRSNYDPIILGWAVRARKLAFISKPENLRLPVIGRMLHKACYLSIDRENDREALKTILTAIDLVKRKIVSIGVFPEGTRSAGAELLPFRNGAFKIAQRAKCPVVICAIRGTENIRRFSPWSDTDVELELVDVIAAEQVAQMTTTEIGELAKQCMISALSDDC